MKKVKIIGATGYGGLGMIDLLLQHPGIQLCAIAATENIGKPIAELYPHLQGFCDLVIQKADDTPSDVDITIFATPDRVGMQLVEKELSQGARIIDFSGDFRFNTPEAYAEYASRIGLATHHLAAGQLTGAVYGLPELHRHQIGPQTKIVGNPGCFAVSCILGLAPATQARLIDLDSIICDCKTGISGAGKKPNATFHYPARYENMNAYRLAGHQHVCEVERELGLLVGTNDLRLTFTAQVIPMCRGIMSTLYANAPAATEAELMQCYADFYADSPFVRVLPSAAATGTIAVRETNYCNLVVSLDERTHRMRIVSYIDNLMKGQAGSAVQNLNLMLGLDETTGLGSPGHYP